MIRATDPTLLLSMHRNAISVGESNLNGAWGKTRGRTKGARQGAERDAVWTSYAPEFLMDVCNRRMAARTYCVATCERHRDLGELRRHGRLEHNRPELAIRPR